LQLTFVRDKCTEVDDHVILMPICAIVSSPLDAWPLSKSYLSLVPCLIKTFDPESGIKWVVVQQKIRVAFS
jgi:hypothetical protein